MESLMNTPVTALLLIIILITSIKAFSDPGFLSKLVFVPATIKRNKEWYRFISHGFVHADPMHLIFNMISFYSFGVTLEQVFVFQFQELGVILYLLLFLGGLVFSSLFDYFKYQNNYSYAALGASGAVSAVIFAFIAIYPTARIGLMFIPIPAPAWVFGLVYLAYCQFMARAQVDNVGHNAHFWGSIFGLVFVCFIKPEILANIINIIF
jgi:membrane associated rhomboid family serine protease